MDGEQRPGSRQGRRQDKIWRVEQIQTASNQLHWERYTGAMPQSGQPLITERDGSHSQISPRRQTPLNIEPPRGCEKCVLMYSLQGE